jgi:hypothetical protein
MRKRFWRARSVSSCRLGGRNLLASARPTGSSEHFHLVFTAQSGAGPIFACEAFSAAGCDYQTSNGER